MGIFKTVFKLFTYKAHTNKPQINNNGNLNNEQIYVNNL